MTLRSDEPSEQQKRIDEARAYINSAPNNEERQLRKREMYVALYSTGYHPKLFDYLKAEAKQRANPLDTDSTP